MSLPFNFTAIAFCSTFLHCFYSLQATWIRNTLLRAMREQSPAFAKLLPMNIVYQEPTISALTEAVLRIMNNEGAISSSSTAEYLVRLAERYSSNLPGRPALLRPRETTKDVVLIKGTTGGFGCDILEHLLDQRAGT